MVCVKKKLHFVIIFVFCLYHNLCTLHLLQVNLHPVRIALSVGASDILQMNINKAWRLLEHMCEKESKRSENVNEVS